MTHILSKKRAAILALAVPLAMGLPVQAIAQDGEIEEVIITGTRVADRSAADSPVPVDVISGSEFRDNASTDVQDMLRTSVPSFDVNTQPISDAATISRPVFLMVRRVLISLLFHRLRLSRSKSFVMVHLHSTVLTPSQVF